MRSKRIAIIGGSIWGNRGAAAMLETTIGKLRAVDPEIKFSVFTPYPLKDQSLVNDAGFEFFDSRPVALIRYFFVASFGWLLARFKMKRNFSGGVHALANSDMLLDIGGITFADGRLIFLPYNILSIWYSMMFGVPVIKMSQAAGSFKNFIIRLFARIFLSRCDHFFARGEKTLAFLEELGIDSGKLDLASDIAFEYKAEYSLSAENTTAVSQLCASVDEETAQGKKIIAISPSVVVMKKMEKGGYDYIQQLNEVIKKTYGKDIVFIVFPNASREGSKKARNNDIKVIELFRDNAELNLPSPVYHSIRWITFDINTKGVEEVVKRADVLLASRFHAMIFGLRLSIPTVVIGWSHKYKEVMEKFGQSDYVFDYTSDTNHIVAALVDILDQKEQIVSDIQSALKEEKSLSSKQFEYVIGKMH